MVLLDGVPVFLSGKEYWENPDVFNPDRFFDEQGKLIVPEAFIPFSYGKFFTPNSSVSKSVDNWGTRT